MLLPNFLKSYRGRFFTKRLLPVFFTGLSAYSSVALAAVAQAPLFLVIPAKPNLMFTLDNSGSMSWSSVTGKDAKAEFNSSRNFKAFHSSAYNKIYYNPATTYTPGINYDGSEIGASATNGARIDPFPTKNGSTAVVDLTPTCYAKSPAVLPFYSKSDFSANTSNCSATKVGSYVAPLMARYMFYYNWNGTGNPTGVSGEEASYTRVDILPGTVFPAHPATRTDCLAAICTVPEEQKNFANWFSYYRTRILMMKTSLGLAFKPIDPVANPENTPLFRVGFNAINQQDDSGAVSVNNAGVTDSPSWLTIREFNKTQKQSFYSKLYAITPSNGTPLRTQMDRIGKLYAGTLSGFDYDGNDPYRASAADSQLLSCRASYHIMSTDGFWNDSYSGVGDVDGTVDAPYVTQASGTLDKQKTADTLADVALYYYKTDLRTDIPNKLPTKKDPLNFQHMRTFTIGLGADGNLAYQTNYDVATSGDFFDIKAGTKDWGVIVGDDPSTIDDLWHTAVNGRGVYYSAGDPAALQAGLVAILNEIKDESGAAASVATTGGYVGDASTIYAPGFESGKWTGHLSAYSVNETTGAQGPLIWDALKKIPDWGSRNIVTWNPASTSAVTFTWANLTTGSNSQQSALGSSDILEYLKGNASKQETSPGSGNGYRYRDAKYLGDIVNSAPQFVKDEDFGYSGLASIGSAYATYVDNKAAKTPMLYVGANDGMLHGFNANTGVETFAFIPNSVYGNLKSLSDPKYSHRYFVDGPVTAGDYHNGSAWKTVLVGSTGAGLISSIFAIDISNPDSLGTSSVMWEKTAADTGLDNLGNVTGEMVVGRLPNGESVFLVGNGYDSKNYKASLFLIKVADGTVLKEFDLGGSATEPNGLSAPSPLFNRNHELIGAYAGDTNGNLWKFSFIDAANKTTVSYSSSKLFRTNMNAAGLKNIQPIAQKPNIQVHPKGGYLISVGTGKFVAELDKTSIDTQSVYGIWDKPGSTATVDRDALVEQRLTAATGGRTLTSNTVDWASKSGWYINLLTAGERVVGDLLLRDNTILLTTTFVPKVDLCDGGGVSQIMGFNGLSGSAADKDLFSKVDGTVYTKLSSVEIAGTQANPVAIKLTSGKTVLKFNNLDGSQGQLIYNSVVPAFRTWRQIIFKN
jgi:type IV pilus assembly protein PilY1